MSWRSKVKTVSKIVLVVWATFAVFAGGLIAGVHYGRGALIEAVTAEQAAHKTDNNACNEAIYYLMGQEQTLQRKVDYCVSRYTELAEGRCP